MSHASAGVNFLRTIMTT